jgi:hypothetical protein
MVLYEDPGHRSVLQNIQDNPCDFSDQQVSPLHVTHKLLGVCVLKVSGAKLNVSESSWMDKPMS